MECIVLRCIVEINLLTFLLTQTASEGQSAAETQSVALKTEVESLTKEQDDLLVLLAEQDTKMRTYRKRLKELGETVIGLPYCSVFLVSADHV